MSIVDDRGKVLAIQQKPLAGHGDVQSNSYVAAAALTTRIGRGNWRKMK